jgi:serine protease Do
MSAGGAVAQWIDPLPGIGTPYVGAEVLKCSPCGFLRTGVLCLVVGAATVLCALLVLAPQSAGPVSSGVASNDTFIALAKSAKTAVVDVFSTHDVNEEEALEPSHNLFFDGPFFRRFFGDQLPRKFHGTRSRREQGLGSGVIVSAAGYIATNNHVVEGADHIKVMLVDKRSFEEKVIGTDPKTDVGVIKITTSDLPTLLWGTPARCKSAN